MNLPLATDYFIRDAICLAPLRVRVEAASTVPVTYHQRPLKPILHLERAKDLIYYGLSTRWKLSVMADHPSVSHTARNQVVVARGERHAQEPYRGYQD